MVNHHTLEKAEIKRRTYSLSVDELSKRINELSPSQEALETQFHQFPNILEPQATVQRTEPARLLSAIRVTSRAPPAQSERSVEPQVLKRRKNTQPE
jgi:hypothetical protein